MSDTIHIQDMEVMTKVGVPDLERKKPQKISLSIKMMLLNFKKAAKHDDINQTVNYYEVAGLVKKIAHEKPRCLIETLAEEVAQKILKNFKVKKVRVEIKKFILPKTRFVSVSLERKKK